MASRPDDKTPIDETILVCRALAALCGRNRPAFASVLGDGFDGQTEGRELAQKLDAAQIAYHTEQREDVAVTSRKDAAVAETASLARATIAAVQLAYHGDPRLDDVLGDFRMRRPSHLRTVPTAHQAIRTMRAGLAEHAARLSAAVAIYDDLVARADRLHATFDALGDERASETDQTRSARRKRDQARDAALDFIERVQLAAEVAALDHPELLDRVHLVYETHNPQSHRSTADERLEDREPTGDDPTDATEPTDVPDDAPTPPEA